MSRRKHSRRKYARAEVDWPVTIAGDQNTIQGRIKNISRNGALLYIPEELDLHEQIRLAVEIPECDDVISAKGEVVRIFSVITGRQVASFGIGVKFTEISDEDLRYFTGNLSPEWQEDYDDSSVVSRSRRSYVKQILYGLSVIFLVFVTSYVLRLSNSSQIGGNQIVELENRMNLLEEQLAALKTSNSYGINLDDQVSKIQNQLVDMQGKFETFATIEKLQDEVRIFDSKLKEINRSVELSGENGNIIHFDKIKQATPLYYYVKKGDSLSSLSISYGMSVDRIRKLNSIAQNELIQPGQKIIIGWK